MGCRNVFTAPLSKCYVVIVVVTKSCGLIIWISVLLLSIAQCRMLLECLLLSVFMVLIQLFCWIGSCLHCKHPLYLVMHLLVSHYKNRLLLHFVNLKSAWRKELITPVDMLSLKLDKRCGWVRLTSHFAKVRASWPRAGLGRFQYVPSLPQPLLPWSCQSIGEFTLHSIQVSWRQQ